MKRLFAVLISSIAWVTPAQSPALADNADQEMYNVFAKEMEKDSANDAELTAVVNSALGDRFFKAFLAGDNKLASKYFQEMLTKLKDMKSINRMDTRVGARITLDIPDGEESKPQYSHVGFGRFMLTEVEKKFGKHHRFYAEALGILAYSLEGRKQIKEAIPYRQQQYKVLQKLDPTGEKTVAIFAVFAVDEFRVKNLSAAEPDLKKAFELSAKYGYPFGLAEAGKNYYKLLLATNRPAEAQELLTKYRAIYPRISAEWKKKEQSTLHER